MSERSTSRKKTSKARERYEARKRRRESMAVRPSVEEKHRTEDPIRSAPRGESLRRLPQASLEGIRQINWSEEAGKLRDRVRAFVADAWWYARRNRQVWIMAAVALVVLVFVLALTSVFAGDVPRGVRVMDVSVGGLSHDEAVETLRAAWNDTVEIELVIDSAENVRLSPASLGISLDADATIDAAEAVGLQAFPFGASVEPVLTVDFITAQNTLLDIADQVNTRPVNARYEYLNGAVVGIPGAEGYQIDTTTTIDFLTRDIQSVIIDGKLKVWMTTLTPDILDPTPYVEEVTEMVSQPFELKGYDPYTNQFFTWPIQPETLTTWIEAGARGLRVNEARFNIYMDALNQTLNTDGTNQRYLAPSETITFINEALATKTSTVNLRVRHRPTVYTVQRGDRGFSIARRTGLPFYLIEQANSGRDMDLLYAGDVLNIPSPDDVMPEVPIPNKRIVVDLTNLYLIAFEDGQIVFEWPISIGVENAPTYPGVFQILSHEEKAYGSSNTLCDAAGLVCGQWEMSWFMGVYEAVPGLYNGFHGSVLLPNGNLLGDGAIGYQNTFGCVMSPDDNAYQLYEWAEVGTTVEIISNEYAPTSDLGRFVQQTLNGGNA